MADIVLLFRGNPRLIINEEQIASRVGKDVELVKDDLRKLVKLGILNMEKGESQDWFGFDVKKDRKIQRIIETYIRNYGDTKRVQTGDSW